MKKEYLILIVLILGLSTYLFVKKDDQVHYQLPEMPVLKADTIDRIEIQKKEAAITLSRSKEAWTVTDQHFPVDKSAVKEILDTLEGLSISALVSESRDLVRYELDPDHAVVVKAFSKDKPAMELSIGKAAPSFNHTYVMLKGDTKVFQADKNFGAHFKKSVEDFRDKLVLAFKSGEINGMTIEKDGKRITLEKVPAKPVLTESSATADDQKTDDKKADDQKAPKAAEPEPVWKNADGTSPDRAAIDNLISSLSHFEAQSFVADKAPGDLEKQAPVLKISLEKQGLVVLHLFGREDEDAMTGTVSTSPYVFTLASFKAKDILSYADKLLGIEKKQEEPADKE